MNQPLNHSLHTFSPLEAYKVFPASAAPLTVSISQNNVSSADLICNGERVAQAVLSSEPAQKLTLTFAGGAPCEAQRAAVVAQLSHQFSLNPQLEKICIELLEASFPLRDLPFLYTAGNELFVERSGFYQTPLMWLGHQPASRNSVGLMAGPDGRDHPRRPPHPQGLFYERYDRESDLTVSFRSVDLEKDLDLFHRWMNDRRVAYFWELDESKDKLRSYLEAFANRPHTYPLISCINGEDAGYFETYWVREDRLGPYYDSQIWDRGWHGLIGERSHLGRAKTSATLRSLLHYLFLDCPMTEQVMGEPRADNTKLLSYASTLGYKKLKEFDFPHKRSALMECTRDRFFSKVAL
ncbi:GNAT family N-acetyltransferase [Flexibacterium corallicola]|uniref:GNAT family N-acetyltransferase n=1 Tax=Flexibacterium corallicola TaxID=3037259 RepID=UPI00286EFA57|nr:GNAT family N-acetyltransferase [Pseudovibrio sp. M1P-2-3]